ncbi:MAG: hypothetical protein EOO12_00970 [Chitinophagaceae bacterium]|nr:MAG: hypothetical protein EOO12_00970 [Chitinophagaceae bacterium]
MKGARTLFFFLLCAAYAIALYFLVRYATNTPEDSPDALGYTMRNLIGGTLLATYLFFILQHFVTGKVATEYLVIMPPMILIAAFLIGAVLRLFGVYLSGNPFAQAGILSAIFSLAVALRMWRYYWMPRPKTNPHDLPS